MSIADRLSAAAAAAAGASVSGTAALVTLLEAGGVGVTELGERIGLSQPAAVRMLDQLVAKGLAERRQRSARSVAVHLTRGGRAAARRALAARGSVLAGLVGELPAADRVRLGAVLEKLLVPVYREVASHDVVCRLCDRAACTGGGERCPVGVASGSAG